MAQIGTDERFRPASPAPELMTGSNLALGGVVALQAVPAMLFGPLGGIAVDLLDKRKLMVASIGVIFNTTRTALRHSQGRERGLGLIQSSQGDAAPLEKPPKARPSK